MALRELSLRCRDAYRPLTEAAGIADMIRDTGWLSVYRDGGLLRRGRGGVRPCSAGAG